MPIVKRKSLPQHPLVEAFMKHVTIDCNGCWMWRGGLVHGGYGSFTCRPYGYFTARAHRASYEIFNGPIPEGHVVRHKCDNTGCVNPEHLITGTQADNIQDAISRGRLAIGARHGCSKLTEHAVVAIRADTRKQRTIAKEYQVSEQTICDIKKRRSWAHVSDG